VLSNKNIMFYFKNKKDFKLQFQQQFQKKEGK